MRNIWILTLAQAFSACGTIMLVAFGGIAGSRIAPEPLLATLPLSLSVFGIACTSLPAALLMQRTGRKPAFIGSACIAALAALGCSWSIAHNNFWALCLSAFFIGSNMAFVQQYRFAAAEYVPPELAGHAIATVMLGTLCAAILGPSIGQVTKSIGHWPEFTGSYLMLAGLCLCAALVLSRLPAPASVPMSNELSAHSLNSFLKIPAYRFAVLCGVTSYAVMSFIMTATPLSMHVHDGISSSRTTSVITAHLLSMYIPSLAAPFLIHKLGVKKMIHIGVLSNLASVVISAVFNHSFINYLISLILLGIGWNLMFVAATSLLTLTYAPEERFRAQGFNDLSVFGSQAIASFLAGTAIQTIGWQCLNIITIPLLLWVLWNARSISIK